MHGRRYRLGYLPPRRTPRRRWRWTVALLAVACLGGLIGFFSSPSGDRLETISSDKEAKADPAPVQATPSPLLGQGGAVPRPKEGPLPTPQSPPPPVLGHAVALVEEPCGALLYAVNHHERLAPASLTKIVTALVAVDRAPLSAMVRVDVDGGEVNFTTGSTVMGLKRGMTLSLRDLLYGLLLPSGNDAALAIAQHVAGSVPAFVEMMNRQVQRLGLQDSQFRNPHGLDDPEHYSSAYDMAMLALELLHRRELAEMVAARTYQPAWEGPLLWNNNPFLYWYPGAIGVKIGYTDEARQTIVAAAEKEGRRLIVSILRSEDAVRDAEQLLDWAFVNIAPQCSPERGR